MTFLFLITSIGSFGQICDTINGKIVNCVDNIGQKQGLWEDGVYYWLQQRNYGPVPGFCQTAPIVKTRTGVIATGYYRDNKKIGTWKYFRGDNLTIDEREVTYNDNGTIMERNFIYNSFIECNNDSTIISGYVFHHGDTINVFCSNKKGIFKLDNDKIILTFDCPNFYRFNFKLSQLTNDIYDREIKLIKLSAKTN